MWTDDPDLLKKAVTEAVRPFFQRIMRQLEELKWEVRDQRLNLTLTPMKETNAQLPASIRCI